MRWSKFWWQDYERDPVLRSCSLASQGLWMRMLCFMHEGEPYGHLTMNGKPPTPARLAAMIGKPPKEVIACLAELNEAGVFSINDGGVMFSRRLVRDKTASDAGRAFGVTGGNPSLKAGDNGNSNPPPNDGGLTPPLNIQEEEEKKEKKEPPVCPPIAAAPAAPSPPHREHRGTRLPDDWQPTERDRAYAIQHGLNPDAVAANFRDYWHAKPGKDGLSAKWPSTWQRWCRTDAERRSRSSGRQTPSEAVTAAFGPSVFTNRFNLDEQFDIADREAGHVRIN